MDDTVTYVGALMATGDVIAQTVIDKKSFNAIEWTRVGRFAFIGATLIVSTYLMFFRFTENSSFFIVLGKYFLVMLHIDIFSGFLQFNFFFL